MKRYGPYSGSHGHLFWSDTYEDGTRRTVLVHREVMEKHLGRQLTDVEVVHHVNEDPTDNRVENLMLMSREDHASHHARPFELVTLVCCECGTTFQRRAHKERWKSQHRETGPFCGKSCLGTWSGRQWGRGRGAVDVKTKERVCGTRSAYRNGCRCDLCKADNANRQAQYRNTKKQ